MCDARGSKGVVEAQSTKTGVVDTHVREFCACSGIREFGSVTLCRLRACMCVYVRVRVRVYVRMCEYVRVCGRNDKITIKR